MHLKVLQLLHRNFFARALIKHPEDPFQSQFEYSFRVALESASSLLSALRSFYEDIPNVLLRYWSIWAHTLNSCVCGPFTPHEKLRHYKLYANITVGHSWFCGSQGSWHRYIIASLCRTSPIDGMPKESIYSPSYSIQSRKMP